MRKVHPHFLAISIMLICANACDDSESNNPQTSMDCQISQADCASQGKTLDETNCVCVDSGSSQENCRLTEAMCASANLTLDLISCSCVDPGTPQKCQITAADCASQGKRFDAEKCICTDSEIPPDQPKTCESAKPDESCTCNTTTGQWENCIAEVIDPECTSNEDCADREDGKTVCDVENGVCNSDQPECPAECPDDCTDGVCTSYNRDCDSIAHGALGCLNGSIVKCTDGELSTVTDCVVNNQLCAMDEEHNTFCKDPDPTDCIWNETTVAKGQTVCDGNLLKTCSANIDTEFDDGTDCADLDPNTPICDPNICREEKYCGDITPGDIVCNDEGTDKVECIDGNLVDLKACTARKNAHAICTYTTEAVCSDACDPGFTDVKGTCEKTKTCIENKEIYIESTNTCACNTDAHYVGTPNACHCDSGYFEDTDHCEAGCLYADTKYNYGDAICSSAGHLLTCLTNGTMNDAVCEKGVCIAGKCEIRGCGELNNGDYQCVSGSLMMCDDGTLTAAATPCTSKQLCLDGAHACVDKKSCTAAGSILDTSTNTCICNSEKGWHGDGSSCSCEDGYVPVSGTCVEKKTCDSTKENYNSTTNTCSCNTAAHWAGTAGNCQCATNYVEIDGACELKKTCDTTKETYDSTTNTCSCNTTAHWTGTAGACKCDNNYVEIGGVCELKKTCDSTKETYNSTTNTCSCNTAAHWAGTAGSCQCATNYVEIGGACELKKTCDSTKETYDSATNTCSCNTAAHWTGTAGACKCDNNYVEIGGVCELKKTCDATKETYNSTTNTCSCNTAAHWAGTAGSCQCATSYVEISGACELKKTCDTTKETYDSTTNTCSCNIAAHWAGTAGNCQCDNNYVEIGGVCELKKTCNSNEKYNEVTNSCACDYSRHFVGSVGACRCENGYVELDGACELKKTCDTTKETYNSDTNTCSCNTAAHWTGTAGSCQCENNYVEIGGVCELKKTCDSVKETYNSDTNTCSCNSATHWAGTAGSCQCANGYVQIGNTCELKKTCNDNETYDAATNSCACDYDKHFVGAAGACTCENGYVQVGSVCELPVTCDAIRETYNMATNTCSCNTAAHWAGVAGACTCATGFYLDGNTCIPDDAEHCRGVDCTAVSYWGDGICTESGQCQVTSCIGDTHLYDNGTNTTCEANTASHCGDHATNCGTHGACVDGECTCTDGYTRCDGVCTNTQTDIDNCGTCGNACAYGLDCISGKCLGNTYCSGVSHNTKTDLDHCGECNHRCDDGTTCVTGECVVAPGPAYCGGQTVQLNTLRHCESCAACADGLLCQNNQCVEGQGQMICNDVIIDSRSDSANCGECDNVCGSGFECVNSACKRITSLTDSTTITCNAQTVKPYNNPLNCAGCGITCASGNVCNAGNCATASVGSIITFGHYEQDNVTSNGKEPIEWRVLDVSNGKTLLISEKVLDAKPYNTTYISITWEKSTIRSWLNGYGASYNTVGTSFTNDNFINTAFTATERAKIVSSGNATTDKIFLLSITEANNYFSSNDDRRADATRYAVKQGVNVKGSESGKYTHDGSCTDVHCYARWWLRSRGDDSNFAASVTNSGDVYDSGYNVNYARVGVRPALWINY